MKKKVFSVMATFALATFIATGNAEAATEQYTVKTGDSLWKIASLHKMTVDELKKMNNLPSDTIKVSQQLLVKKSDIKQYDKQNDASTNEIDKNLTAAKQTSSTSFFKPVVATDKPLTKLSKTAKEIQVASVEVAMPLLDTPYVWAGVTPEGFDCSGFIYYVFTNAGLKMPRLDTVSMFINSHPVDEPVPGDLVFFENTYRSGISHAGIYVGDGKFIHAGTKKVEISTIDSAYWKDKFVGFTRFTQLQSVK
ncbi:C40 family peptidase [Sporosarcina sp. Marseille-Q4943]|uniref:C40 family peptidase n=1 Tax=Sporosarcina sp. Marseille-Q4943 TaxID=2942204 RepID=UPI00208DC991|nr:C40 family peptidase [Sporosarcina sp. Marseille-Q4943]